MRIPCLLAVLGIIATPLFAEQTDKGAWQYEAVMPGHLTDTKVPGSADINAVTDVVANMLDRWNAHDIDGYLANWWNSPQLLVVDGDDQIQGWQALRDSFRDGYRDPKAMGTMQSTRIQVKLCKQDLALVKTSWSIVYPNSNGDVVGDTTLSIQRFNDGWKVVSAYSTYVRASSRGWQYDSIAPERSTNTPTPEQDELQAINNLLTKMDASWNEHDIDGVLSAYWNSPNLLVVVGEEQFQGWKILYDTYKAGYPNPNAMGHVEPSRVQIKLLKPDLALAINWWAVNYPNSKTRVVGNTTMNLQKFDAGWKIVMAHSSFVEP
jgi:uncharacterized protein (TIGR02246 family)